MEKFYQKLAEYKGQFELNEDNLLRHKETHQCPLVVIYGSMWANDSNTDVTIIGASDNNTNDLNCKVFYRIEKEKMIECRQKMLEILGLSEK